MTIFERVKAVIIIVLGVEEEQVTNYASLENDLHANELTMTELVLALNEEFGIEIPDEYFISNRVETVRDIVDCVGRNGG